jgi:origin recognition complex subunit 5
LVVYGSTATGKSSIINDYLGRVGIPHAIVRSRECVTGRHLLESTVSAVHHASSFDEDGDHPTTKSYNTRCENLGSLAMHMQRLLSQKNKFIVVFDDIDQQRDAPPTLIPALARLPESVSRSDYLGWSVC